MRIGRKEMRIACHVISSTRIDEPRAGGRGGMRRDTRMCKGSRGNLSATMGQLKKMIEISMTQCDVDRGRGGCAQQSKQ